MHPGTSRATLPAARVLLASTLACAATFALPAGCAGTGHRYDDCADAGPECGHVAADAGPVIPTGFISDPVTVRHDGLHNGATDLAVFGGAAVAVFRNAANWSADASGKLVITRSLDRGARWTDAVELKVPGLDLRNPKLSVFKGVLHLVATAWDPRDVRLHATSVVGFTSDDGVSWSGPVDLGVPPRSEAWRPRPVLGQLWMAAWVADELVPGSGSNLLSVWTSDTGAAFSAGSQFPKVLGPGARQGELLVRADGQLWLAVPERLTAGSPEQQHFCHTPLAPVPSWSCWTVAGLGLDGPLLFEHKGLLFVSARHDVGNGRRRTGLWQLLEVDQSVSLIADLPSSMGDTGAPGLIMLDADRALLSFHTTSALDPKVAALGHEPTALEAQGQGFAADVQAVTLYLPAAAAGR